MPEKTLKYEMRPEGVRNGFENMHRSRFIVRPLAFRCSPIASDRFTRDNMVLSCCRSVVDDKSINSSTQYCPGPDVNSTGKSLSSRIASCRAGTSPLPESFPVRSTFPSARLCLRLRVRPAFRALLSRRRPRSRESALLYPCRPAHLVGVGLHPDEVHDAERFFSLRSEAAMGLRPFQKPSSTIRVRARIGPLAVHAAHDNHARQIDRRSIPKPAR